MISLAMNVALYSVLGTLPWPGFEEEISQPSYGWFSHVMYLFISSTIVISVTSERLGMTPFAIYLVVYAVAFTTTVWRSYSLTR